ncbi:Ketopantoate reductase PanE/ApbA [Neomoorella glycerini]|uniref:2-dehydropantoate 2-reductase n=1 Tax=Neomoorella glycerini TaxID=55779 RepID=A0A6I5ZP38_9FIRM|nr:ketopantoate reductase family protein [Moorella glycerini]QGP91375.1 Ketopantoate reductase PanE/ApbA [Moorella glycerini]
MHLVVLGAGALGTLFGVKAWEGGARVTLVAREAHARAINEKGVFLTGPLGGDRYASGEGLRAVTDIAQVEGDIDYLLVTVKDKDMATALESVRPVRDRVKTVFSFQNGITHEERLAEVFGWEKVIGGVTIEGADMPAPGVIEYALASTSYFGEFDGSRSERVEALAEVFRRGGMSIETITEIKVAKWTKFVQICAASGVCGATRLGYAPAVRTLAGAQLYVHMVKEGVAVMRAQGLEPGNYFINVARIKEVGNLPLVEAVELVRTMAEALYQKGFHGNTSLARDLERGKKTEVDALMGTMYRIGERLGVPTPTVRAVYWTIKAADEYAR